MGGGWIGIKYAFIGMMCMFLVNLDSHLAGAYISVTKAIDSYDSTRFCDRALTSVHPVIKPIKDRGASSGAWATRSAFSYKRPAFAYVIIFTFDQF
uniref:Uncharacterized protein n=1 Tax=Hyaloperonospora arabidopsidis (strain Emoy2) TaxID=559515 RepID=M4BZP1_HYAAE